MRGPLIATLAAIATLSGCVQLQPHEPARAPTSDASPTAVVPPAPPTTTPDPVVESDKSQSPTPTPPAPPTETRNAPSNPAPAGRSAPSAAPSRPQGSPPPAQPPVAAAVPAEAPASPPLDLDGLEQRLRDTHAIGVFTKLSLRNQVNDLLERFREFHYGRIRVPLADLRQRYERLLLEVVTLLQDADEPLAKAVASSREAIWGVLANPKTFAKT